MKYTLYHIKGKKWGCTKNLKQRLRKQGYSIKDVCETEVYYDIDTAADREKELNLKYGYEWNDGQDYRVIMKAHSKTYQNKQRVWNGKTFTKEECALGGSITGNKKTPKQQRARRNNVKKLNAYKTCPYCSKKSRGAGYNRWHGDNCKSKEK